MSEPLLKREAEPPQPRSGGALVVVTAGLAMFSAVVASAYVVNTQSRRFSRAAHEAQASAEAARPATMEEDALARFQSCLARHDDEGALDAFVELPADSPARVRLAADRSEVARRYFSVQLARLGDEVDRGECDAADERLARLGRLLPDRELPAHMADCPRSGWSIVADGRTIIPVELVER